MYRHNSVIRARCIIHNQSAWPGILGEVQVGWVDMQSVTSEGHYACIHCRWGIGAQYSSYHLPMISSVDQDSIQFSDQVRESPHTLIIEHALDSGPGYPNIDLSSLTYGKSLEV